MKGTRFLVLAWALLGSSVAFAQNSDFTPKGKMIARSFMDLGVNTGKRYDGVNMNLTRAFLGYNYKFAPELQATVVADLAAGKDGKGALTPYLRNAFLQWNHESFQLNAGVINLLQFHTAESYWGHRYAFKSFQDQNKMGPSVDAGLTAAYKFAKKGSVDLTLINGEGAKRLIRNKNARYGLGATVSPAKHLLVRLYADVYTSSKGNAQGANLKNQYTYSAFLGYKSDKFMGGLEYDLQQNNGWANKKDVKGYSVFGTYFLNKKTDIFARFDHLMSSCGDNHQCWNPNEGSLALLGAEFKPCKELKVSPNLRYSHSALTKKNNVSVYVNLEFNL